MKTEELTGAALDWAVAQCEGGKRFFTTRREFGIVKPVKVVPPYSTNWAQGGKIIEREKIGLDYFPDGGHEHGGEWFAACNEGEISSFGLTPLVAAMRCFVSSKLGDEINLPEELK